MRPVLLDMDGFASFRDPATVDFADTDYFALVGPTGSGKSTVIDAMTFALYGTVPRWQDKRMVMYALAPTAVRGTVRLVFDVEPQRYVVARELRRAKNGGVTVKSARLERLLDPTTVGTINDPTEVIAADGLVTAAVEKLLGLSFEHFCQCVVLPQGEFAEFLRAKGSDRREILLKLLGAGLYREIGREANSRSARAGERATVLAEQLNDYLDASAEMEALAAERESALAALGTRVDKAVPRLREAAAAVDRAERKLADLSAELELLTSVTVPDGIAELDVALTTHQLAVGVAIDAEQAAQDADAATRQAAATAPNRGPLEQVRREHAEQRRILGDIPAAKADLEAAAGRLELARLQSESATALVETTREARNVAATEATATGAVVARVSAELESLMAVSLPAGLTELENRTRLADRELQDARQRLEAAERRDELARTAIRTAPRRAPLELALRNFAELADATAGLVEIQDGQRSAAADLDRTQAALSAAIAARDEAREARDRVAVANGAASLRPHLIAGEACPVCEQVVETLPPPLHVAKLAAAEKAFSAAETIVERARADDSTASRLVAAVNAQLAAANDRIATLRGVLAGGPTSDAEVRLALDGLDRLDTDADAAEQQLRLARTSFTAAQAAARQVEADSAALRSDLHRARDPLVAMGAPGVDVADLMASWTSLAEWATAQAVARRGALPGAQSNDSSARAAVSAAESALTDAVTRAGQARKSEMDATGSHERARAALTGLQTRLGELTATLIDAPTDAEAQAQLARIDELAAAARDADTALVRARAVRQQAEQESRALDRQATAAWQVLRKTRDGLIAFGAPDLPDGPVFTAWTTLTAWAVQNASDCAEALTTARDSLDAATVERDSTVLLLESDFAAMNVELPPGELSSTAPVAAATAVSHARAERTRIVERREQAARLSADHATADTERQVAGMLGNLLRSNQFPEWLEAAALDTLVADASLRLAELSNGQFELTHRNGEFFVVDHADADSQRGVRTLSGGETFQASLALALALSTQLSSMAAAGAARLDSIFLDEGFGTLDESTLEVVAATLENLAQGDRMVGVVTHVAALAERVPVRFVVNRDSRTSSISRETV